MVRLSLLRYVRGRPWLELTPFHLQSPELHEHDADFEFESAYPFLHENLHTDPFFAKIKIYTESKANQGQLRSTEVK